VKIRPKYCLLFGLLLLAACGSTAPGVAPPRDGIVSMAPNLTETIFALGQGHRVIAVGDYDDYPPEIATLPRAGGYLDPDLEKITMLAPGLMILPGRHQQVTEYARLNRLQVLNVDMDSLQSIDAGIATLGEALGANDAARALRERMRADAEAVRAAVAGLPRPRVLIITWRQPRDMSQLYTAGGDAFISEIVDLAGGENLYAGEAQRYFEASKETIVVAAPEVVLEFHAGAHLRPEEIAALQAEWQVFASLPAVRTGRVHIITESHALRPGPRLIEIAWMLAGLLHPEALAHPPPPPEGSSDA
jgi:iron complex transport system substrate-binding protein